MGLGDVGWLAAGLGGKRGGQPFIGGEVSEDAGQEPRFAGGDANLGRADAGHGEETTEPLAIPGDEGKRLNCKPFCRLNGDRTPGFHRSNLPFRKISALPCLIMPDRARPGDAADVGCGALGTNGAGEMPKTVLIVEDNELNMKLFHDLLEAHGYQTVGTRNGIEALDLARKHRPDLILMDIQLPEVSGLEVTKWLKDDPELKAIPVVAVTAFAMKGDEERIREVGCEAYLSKPISVGKFIETIRHFLGNA